MYEYRSGTFLLLIRGHIDIIRWGLSIVFRPFHFIVLLLCGGRKNDTVCLQLISIAKIVFLGLFEHIKNRLIHVKEN